MSTSAVKYRIKKKSDGCDGGAGIASPLLMFVTVLLSVCNAAVSQSSEAAKETAIAPQWPIDLCHPITLKIETAMHRHFRMRPSHSRTQKVQNAPKCRFLH